MNIVKLEYFDDFHCTGGECPDCCCKDWHIHISKNEYLNYKKMKCSPKLRSLLDSAFICNEKGENYDYAEIRHKEDGYCPLLREDKLCMIHREQGEKALGFVCDTYPRLSVRVGSDTVRQSCLASCCHVIEVLMGHSEGLRITEEEYGGNNRWINKGQYNELISEQWEGFTYYWNILNAEIDILQNRSFTVSERMLILGYFCRKAEDNIKIGMPEKIPALGRMLLDNELCGKIAASLKPASSDERIASNLVEILSNMHIRVQTTNETHLKKDFLRVMEGISYTREEENGKAVIGFSRTAYNRQADIFRAVENERPYLTENLLVNIMFSANAQRGVWANYFELAVFYGVLKICVPAFLTDNYTDAELAVAVSRTVKMIVNSHLAEVDTLLDYIEGNMNTLPYAAFLVC